ncbi:NAD(P)-binding domain-containing protein [Nocardioides sp. STR2]|uniref:NAD(P)-binding domain-containing protein n=1 Tax=Nocardioides pini TaxID=2975053 RepID=A0ABT4CDU7_9ACTN|nr:NAD(P)-binding domain-containing protein [Nocardioides pini]MCY4727130.1 NAD(P)-binding domain-containing protein [Nocardioides pini]
MTTLGIVGAGHIGSTVARLAVDAGLDVVLANSRGPETLADLVADLGPCARAGTATEAARAGDLVVLTVPLKALGDLPADAFDGQVVLDTGNYYPQRDGHIGELDDESTSSSELTARTLPGARVVKVFNNIFFGHLAALARPQAAAGSDERSVLPIAGDDADAKQAATRAARHAGLRRPRRRAARRGLALPAGHPGVRRPVRRQQRRDVERCDRQAGRRRRAACHAGPRRPSRRRLTVLSGAGRHAGRPGSHAGRPRRTR